MKKLLLLVAAGVAVKYFLNSEHGKEAGKQVKDWLGEAQDSLKDVMGRAGKKAKQA